MLWQKLTVFTKFDQVVFEKLHYGVEALNSGMDEKLATISFNEALDTRPWWSPTPHECSLIGMRV